MTVEECLRRVAEQSPELKSGAYQTEAAARRAQQAGRPLNPRLETEVENVAGSGAVQGVDAAETTVSVAQELELGGKRRGRSRAAQAEADVTRAGQAVRLRTLLAETRRAALAVQAAQAKVRLADEVLALARETQDVAEAREQAGKATALETERSRAEAAQAEIEREARLADQRDAVRELALCWGEAEPSFDAVADALGGAPQPRPPLDALLLRAAAAPEQLAAEAQVRSFEARIGVERAARLPNVELSLGVRRFEEGGDVGFVAGAGVELPLHTRNMDGVRAAEADAEAARLEATAARLKRESRIRLLYARLDTLEAKIARQKAAVLPLAERALALVREAHKQGKAGYLDVLEARRALVDARLRLIETQTEHEEAGIELGRLTDTP